MSAVSREPRLDWDAVLHAWHELDVPEGWRAEVTSEGIMMAPPPGGHHNLIADSVHRSVLRGCPENIGVFQTLGVGVPTSVAIFIPDITVVDREDVPVGATPVPAEQVLLAAEITSSANASADRKRKKWCYAHGGVPLYLLIDPHAEEGPSASVFSDPRNGSYRHVVTVPFGDKLELPGPVEITIDTSEF